MNVFSLIWTRLRDTEKLLKILKIFQQITEENFLMLAALCNFVMNSGEGILWNLWAVFCGLMIVNSTSLYLPCIVFEKILLFKHRSVLFLCMGIGRIWKYASKLCSSRQKHDFVVFSGHGLLENCFQVSFSYLNRNILIGANWHIYAPLV